MPSCAAPFALSFFKDIRLGPIFRRSPDPKDSTPCTSFIEKRSFESASTVISDSNVASEPTRRTQSQKFVHTSLNALTGSISLLAEAPFPGASLTAQLLQGSIERMQGMDANVEGFESLTQRMQTLETLVANGRQSDSKNWNPLLRELKRLAVDIEEAADEGSIARFFNCDDNASKIKEHTEKMDSMMIDLSVQIGHKTQTLVEKTLRAIQTAESQRCTVDVRMDGATLDTRNPNGHPGGEALFGNTGPVSFSGMYSSIKTGGGAFMSRNRPYEPPC